MRFIAVSFIILALGGCRNSGVDKIYENRVEIQQLFEDIIIDKRGDVIYLSIRSDSLNYNYMYIQDEDSLYSGYNIAELNKIIRYNPPQKYTIQQFFFECMNKMKEYGILSVSSDFQQSGVALKLYTEEAEIMYVPDKSKVTNERWKKYIELANKIDDSWYWIAWKDMDKINNKMRE